MSRPVGASGLWRAIMLGALVLQACEFATSRVATPSASQDGAVRPPLRPAMASASPEIQPEPSDATGAAGSPTTASPAPVTVSAVNGNVFIRRGPDLAFNPIAVLTKGQTAVAKTRDVLGQWLEIPVPEHAETTGWITIITKYTVVAGDVRSLPEAAPTEWPVLASLRNCTYHLMQAEPGGISIPPVNYFPDNEVRINPGVYSVHDLDVDKAPEVLRVDVREGSAIEIRVDGLGGKRKCPIP